MQLGEEDNRLDESGWSKPFHPKAASCSNNLQEVCQYRVASSLMFTDLAQLEEDNRLDET